jgi:DNA mismatch repair protein MutL
MGKIIVLDENTSNKIAAGEVIERPASVVKELLENSIDAGATSISVEIKNGGITFIKINDNGSGIDEDDVELAFERHATSKIKNSEDLESIATLGFRGEALASIASVASVELTSRVKSNQHGTLIKIKGGKVKEVNKTGCPVGTTFVVKDLFYNTPARFKFLKKDSTEAGYISDIITRVALAKPHIALKLVSNNTLLVHTPGNNDLLSVIYSIYGKETSKNVIEINYTDNKVKMTGYAGKTDIARSSRTNQSIFVNGRYIKSKLISSAIDEAYKTYLLKNKYAFIVLSLEINPMLIDVNVHPTKMDIRFSDEQEIFRSVYHAISSALIGKDLSKNLQPDKHEHNPFKFNNEPSPKLNYSQQNINLNSPYLKEQNPKNLKSEFNFEIERSNVSKDKILEDKTSDKTSEDIALKDFSIEDKTSKFNTIEDKASKDNDIENKASEYNILQEKTSLNYFIGEPSQNNRNLSDDTNRALNSEDILSTNVLSKNKTFEESNLPQKDIINSSTYENSEYKKNQVNFDNSIIIGQLFSTYILLQNENELVLIDQHAAHERIRYEYFREKYKNNESLSQELISPIVIELTNHEIKFLIEEQEFFDRLGFKYEDFGNNSIILRSVPLSDEGVSIKIAFLEVIDTIISKGKQDYKKIADETIYTIACKSAVKANKKMNELEIRSLIKELSTIDNPYTCPHGRPTIIKLTKYELEKMFKRII